MPAAVTTNVTAAASRAAGSATADASAAASAPRSASPATAETRTGGDSRISAVASPAPRPSAASPTPAVTEAIQRRPGSGSASGPAASAALIAARFTACPPKGAAARVPSPVAPRIGARPGPVAVGREHGHPRHVLRRHRHEEQRQPDSHQRRRVEPRRGPLQHGRQVRSTQSGAGHDDAHGRDDQCGRHRPRPGEPADHRPHDHDRNGQQRYLGDGLHRFQAQRQQHAGEHGPGDRRRDRPDEPAQRPDQAREHDQRAAQQERPDRRREAAGLRSGRDEQRRSGRRPGDAHRHPGAQPEHHRDDSRRQAHRQQPGRRLPLVRADRPQPGEHHRERAAEPDQRRHHTRQHRPQHVSSHRVTVGRPDQGPTRHRPARWGAPGGAGGEVARSIRRSASGRPAAPRARGSRPAETGRAG